jgi:hypothetical protein
MAARTQRANRSVSPILRCVTFDAGDSRGRTRGQLESGWPDGFAYVLSRGGAQERGLSTHDRAADTGSQASSEEGQAANESTAADWLCVVNGQSRPRC